MIEVAHKEERLESVDLVVDMLEMLAGSGRPMALGEIAAGLGISKPRAHRHLRALVQNLYVAQDRHGDRYEIGPGLLRLGEMARGQSSFAAAARDAMVELRDRTDQTVTASTLIDDRIVIVELLQGRTLVQFAIRPGTEMDPERSAHGLVALAFGPARLRDRRNMPDRLEQIRRDGFATAPGLIVTGVNALAAPVFGADGQWQGTVAIVGSIDAIPADPPAAMVALVRAAADQISTQLGGRGAA